MTYGQRTSDDAELWFQVVPRNQTDRDVFTAAFVVRLSLKRSGYEMMIRADASNVGLHDDVALMYASIGNRERTAAHFAESARLRPGSAAAQYNLGMALFLLGRNDEALHGFDRALAIDPQYANAHRGKADVLRSLGRIEEARRAGHDILAALNATCSEETPAQIRGWCSRSVSVLFHNPFAQKGDCRRRERRYRRCPPGVTSKSAAPR